MRSQLLLALSALVLSVGVAEAGPYRAPRDAEGHPDLGGLWTSTSLTELERPKAFATLTVSDAEARAYEQRRPDEFANTDIDDIGGRQTEAGFWTVGAKLARIDGKARTSWLIDPPDGRLPYSAQGQAARAREAKARSDSANPETRTVSERCLIAGWAAAGPPMLNGPYGNEYQIVQTKGAVAIHMEGVHDVRIVRLNAPHLPAHIRPWLGDSIGRWDGESLVVETTNFNAGDAFKTPMGMLISADAKVTERFTRTGPQTLLYDFTVDDPATFTRPWRAQMVFAASKGPIYEYACHEGNYSLPGILAGARREEAEARAARK
ncbi:hypothetical protein [Phenylobacterium sp.]|jgi:hypothetical protein|uniref:hypothetical protein n=1 Tax=Phenylobacterium sp. TaxID=1871053 RepID=UPI002E32F5F4|nr:hypothetical protein [Phenylobacterium sp.]HEX4712835.1 hypothetical protein [Phenylobacterium sp.]